MNLFSNQRFLVIYSAVLTISFAATAVYAVLLPRSPTFGTITARRINIVEPDGTVRMTISNRADFPGAWYHKKESPRPDRRDAAGILFMSEEGSEQGGLIWGANQRPDGRIESPCHLSFDQYEDNQIFAIDAGQEGNDRFSRITILDQGDFPIGEKRDAHARIESLPEGRREAAWTQFFRTHRHDVPRLVFGRSRDGSVGLDICDSSGRVRMRLAVYPDGKGVLQFLDESGNTVRQITGEKK